MKKKLPKKQWGGPKVKTREKSPSGNYVKVTKVYDDPNNKGEITTTRRTVKGFLTGAPRVRQNQGGVDDSRSLSSPKYPERRSVESPERGNLVEKRRGGAVKRAAVKRKK